MREKMLLAIGSVLLLVWTTAAQEPGDTLWTRTYGGIDSECGYSGQQTTDGGYAIAGYTKSFGAGYGDFYLVKADANGNSVWTRTYGGTSFDYGYSGQQTSDGGYILAGSTMSFGAGSYDFYLVKTDANGDTLWTRTYGGSVFEEGMSVQETSDGGYAVAGYTNSFGAGSMDCYLVKTDADGDTLWTRTYGGSGSDYATSVQQTSDGGYVVTGRTQSFGAGSDDVYLVKTDANGDTLWTRTYGGRDRDYGWCAQETSDGGYIVAGHTNSFGAGGRDVYLVKTDANGNSLWTHTYGGVDRDEGRSVLQTSDDGYIIAGYTNPFGADSADVYLVKTDANGNSLWTHTYGGGLLDKAYSVQQTSDGDYIVSGHTESFGAGSWDAWLLRIAGGAQQPEVSIEIVPDDPPVTVPQGGSFRFTGTLANNTEDPQVVDAWVMAVGPEPQGICWGPFKEFHDLELAAFDTLRGHFNQRVPNLAPLGFYSYIAYCGDYASTVIDSSFFQVEVVAGPLTQAGEGGWVLTGSFLEGDLASTPSEFGPLSNYPNPFNAGTVIHYQLPADAHVELEVYNLLGQKVATLVDSKQEAGYRSAAWDASEVSSGLYFYRLTAGDFTEIERMMLMK